MRDISQRPNQEMKRILGVTAVTLLGVGALLGGGVFTILGTTIGIAGTGGSIIAIAGLAIGFSCIIAIYAELGTTFPEAGGGYLWIREGLGDLQGFLSGWISWFAHAAAAGLYALSFGFYVGQALSFFDIHLPNQLVRIIGATAALIILGFINWRGVKILSHAGNIIALAILGILVILILAGLRFLTINPGEIKDVFQDGFPAGLLGVLGAMAFFFIAFEGSEIQAQAAEEMRNPARDLPRALFWARIIITLVYLLLALTVIVGFPNGGNLSQTIGKAGEYALPQAAAVLIPGGLIVVTIGGLLVNLAAINATIFSSSHVVLAMARSRHLLQGLAAIHTRNRTPHRAILITTLLVITLAIFFPIKEVASLADFLFILLFLQVIIAFIALRRHQPQAERPFRVPGYPLWPLATAALLVVMGATLVTHVSMLAGIIGAIWVLFGLLNYYAYASPMEHQEIEELTVFSHAWKTGKLSDYRILLPVAKEVYAENLYDISLALAKERGSPEISILEIDETPGDHLTKSDVAHARTEPLLAKLVERGRKLEVSTEGLLLDNADPVRAILGLIALHHINLLILGWDGHARGGMIFSSKVDTMLREARCDTLIIKLVDLEHLKRILLCIPPEGTPHLRYMGKVASSLARAFQGTIDVVTVIPPNTSLWGQARIRERIQRFTNRMKLGVKTEPRLIPNTSAAEAILEMEKTHDTIILGAARERFFREIRVGSVAEEVTKRTKKTAIIVKGHQGITPPLWQYLRERV